MQDKIDLLVLPAIKNIEEIVRGVLKPIRLTKGKFCDLEFRFKDNALSLIHSGVDIKNFSYVWLSSYWGSRDLAYAVKLYLEHFMIRHTFVEKATSKVTDQIIFALNHISIPNTFFIDNPDISNCVETIEDICGYPLIIKDITGSGGKSSVLIGNRIELIRESARLDKHKKYLFQKYIPNEYDWGILISNGKVVSAEQSYPEVGEFRNNSCNGATEVFMGLEFVPEHVKKMALQASSALGLSWSRSDIVVDKDTNIAYLMEVNRCPGVTAGTSEVVGAQDFLRSHLKTEPAFVIDQQLPVILLSQTKREGT